jgi:5-methylcytosine-specific restriction endonuclease McrA
MVLLRLCAKCGATLDPAVHGYRGPCPPCRKTMERDKSRRRRQSQRDIRDARAWQLLRTAVKRRDGDACRGCGARETLGVHHIVPLAKGGAALDADNLVTLCRRCHEREEGNAKSRFLGGNAPSRLPGFREKHSRSPEPAKETPSIG